MSSRTTARVLCLRFFVLSLGLIALCGISVRLCHAQGALDKAVGAGIAVVSLEIALLIVGLTAIGTSPPLRALLDGQAAGTAHLVVRLHVIAIHTACVSLLAIALSSLLLESGGTEATVGQALLFLGWVGLAQAAMITLWLVRNTSRLLLTTP